MSNRTNPTTLIEGPTRDDAITAMDFLHALQESVGERKSFVDLNVRNYNYWAYKSGLEWLLVPTPEYPGDQSDVFKSKLEMLRNADPPMYWVSFISKMELLGFRQARFKYNTGQISNMIQEAAPESVKTADDLCASFCAMVM